MDNFELGSIFQAFLNSQGLAIVPIELKSKVETAMGNIRTAKDEMESTASDLDDALEELDAAIGGE